MGRQLNVHPLPGGKELSLWRTGSGASMTVTRDELANAVAINPTGLSPEVFAHLERSIALERRRRTAGTGPATVGVSDPVTRS